VRFAIVFLIDSFCSNFTSFQDKAEYREHCRQAHREGHECSICRRRFSRRALLRRHESVHTGFKEFTCHLCSYASSHKSNLERHFKTHSAFTFTPLGQTIPKKRRKPRSHQQPPQQPDSTTSGTVPVPKYPILRNMLKDSPSSPSSSSARSKKLLKPKLSHSIESILSRKEVHKKEFIMSQPGPLINYEFPSRLPEEGEPELTTDQDVTNVVHPPPAPSRSIGFSPIINHSLSSPFTTLLTPFLGEDLRNQVRTGPSWRLPLLPPPWNYQDLRIFSSTTNYSREPQQIWWRNPFMLPAANPHLLRPRSNSNYSYPNYGNNGESVLSLL